MSLMGTLAKVAIGYAAARGVDQLAGGKGLGGLMGGAQVSGSNPMSQIQAQMGKMMGGAGTDNPLAGIMSQLQSGGLDLSSIMGGAGTTGGTKGADKGGLLSQIGGSGGAGLAGVLAAAGGMAAMGGKNMGGLLDQFAKSGAAAPQAEDTAALMLRAMIQTAKADGGIDDAERAKILDTVGEDATAEDMAFIREQLAAPIDVEALAKDTPEALRTQVYGASLMTIRLDSQAEAQYLHDLAQAMNLDETTVNTLHLQMGVQPLYS